MNKIESQTKPNHFESVAFRSLDFEMQRWTISGFSKQWIPEEKVDQPLELKKLRGRFNTMWHELKHTIAGIFRKASINLKTAIPSAFYLGLTKLTFTDSNPADRNYSALVTSMASSVEDNVPYTYDRSGRGSDLAQAAENAKIVSILKYGHSRYAGSYLSQARSEASSSVNAGISEDRIWRETFTEAAA